MHQLQEFQSNLNAMISTLKKFLIFLPLAVIVASCSTGIVDTWDPEASLRRKNAEKAKCEEMQNNPTHSSNPQKGIGREFYLDGNNFREMVYGCGIYGVIGKTQVRNKIYRAKLLKKMVTLLNT